ncbi:HNH endonuclease signature motif containing protein [Streptomyces agglomeratus]|uniref:HNH endonuclease signature motif containing protein n=1 Tax=Streptomyces agglomeratus TaxID=285458 RepID=UPI003B8A9304
MLSFVPPEPCSTDSSLSRWFRWSSASRDRPQSVGVQGLGKVAGRLAVLKSRGGGDERENLAVLCRSCNSRKHNR